MDPDRADSEPQADPPPTEAAPSLLIWPPPGLSRIQGDLCRLAGQLLLGGAVLVAPLLLTMAVRPPFDLGGVLGDAWWISSVTTLLGLLILTYAFTGTFRLCRRVARAMRQGYGWVTVLLVATDDTRDTGFVLQGRREFSVLAPGRRRELLVGRLFIAAAAFLGALSISVGFVLSLLLASRGVLGGTGAVMVITLVPTATALLAAQIVAMWSRGVVRRARRAWHRKPWSADLEKEEIRNWTEELDGQLGEGQLGPGSTVRPWVPTTGAVLTLLAAALVAVPTVLLVGVTSLSSALATLATPQIGATSKRAAAVEPFRRYRVAPDSAITASEAGEILQVLIHVGSTEGPSSPERSPQRSYEQPWVPLDEGRVSLPGRGGRAGWAVRLFDRLADELEPEELEFLEEVAGHPATAEIERLARAPNLDIVAGRWVSPLPEDLALWSLPIPRLGSLRDGVVLHHLVRAFVLAREGRVDEAELRIRELISVGFLLLDDGWTLIDNLIGALVIGTSGDALERLLRNTGREEEAAELEWIRASALRAVERTGPHVPSGSAHAFQVMSAIATDTTALRGLRWDMFLGLNTVTPCLNLQRIVFGAGPEYEKWLMDVRASLVRWPSEEEFFELGRHGHFGRAGPEPTPARPFRALRWVMARDQTVGSCYALVGMVLAGGG